MNFYPFHIGDYASRTAHLSELEDLYYRRLMDCYYVRECPLPNDLKAIWRLVRAQSEEAREAVQTVLQEFFEQTADGWVNERCEKEIKVANEKGDESEARKENERERQKRHRERRSALFEALREHGRVPAWDTPTETLQAMLNAIPRHAPVTVTGRDSHGDVTPPETVTQRLTNPNPNPNPKEKKRRKAPACALPEDFAISDRVRAWAEKNGVKNLQEHFDTFCLRAKAKSYAYADWDAALMVAIRENWGKVGLSSPAQSRADLVAPKPPSATPYVGPEFVAPTPETLEASKKVMELLRRTA